MPTKNSSIWLYTCLQNHFLGVKTESSYCRPNANHPNIMYFCLKNTKNTLNQHQIQLQLRIQSEMKEERKTSYSISLYVQQEFSFFFSKNKILKIRSIESINKTQEIIEGKNLANQSSTSSKNCNAFYCKLCRYYARNIPRNQRKGEAKS